MLPVKGTIKKKNDKQKKKTYDSKRVDATPSELPIVGSPVIICEPAYLEILIEFDKLFRAQISDKRLGKEFRAFMKAHITPKILEKIKVISAELEDWKPYEEVIISESDN